MINILIFGAGGMAKEVAHCLRGNSNFNLVGFVDEFIPKGTKIIYGLEVVLNLEELSSTKLQYGVIIAVQNIEVRRKVYNSLSNNINLHFPNIVDKNVCLDDTVKLGIGNIIMHGTLMTCDISIGNFNFFNGASGIGHDVTVGDFNSFGPRCFIAGSVQIGNDCHFMLNSMVLSNVKVPDNVRLLLSSTLFKSPKVSGNYFGSPAMLEKY